MLTPCAHLEAPTGNAELSETFAGRCREVLRSLRSREGGDDEGGEEGGDDREGPPPPPPLSSPFDIAEDWAKGRRPLYAECGLLHHTLKQKSYAYHNLHHHSAPILQSGLGHTKEPTLAHVMKAKDDATTVSVPG